MDVFLTHSWADEELAPGEKYRAIATYAERFRAEHDGREPTIWVRESAHELAEAHHRLSLLASLHDPLLSLTT